MSRTHEPHRAAPGFRAERSSTGAGPAGARLRPAGPLGLQRKAGNRATAGVLAPGGRGPAVQFQRMGKQVTHEPSAKSPFRVISATFDGRDFVLRGDGTELVRRPAQSGRPYSVRPGDARTCGGSEKDSYLNNPLYVGIRENGPIPEGEYAFRATEMVTFSAVEQAKMITGGQHTDPFGASLHGGDWGAGRVALRPRRILPGPPGCGNTRARSGFFLHGGVLTGSSGCIDIGNAGVEEVVRALHGYRREIVVTVRYRHPAPKVGAMERAVGRFTYPPVEGGRDPTMWDRLCNLVR